MTKSSFENFNALLPYDKKSDALQVGFASLRYIPESVDPNPSEETNSGSDNIRHVSKSDHRPGLSIGPSLIDEDRLNRIFSRFEKAEETLTSLKKWIQEFRDGDVLVDIDRITRLVIKLGCNELVKYLVEDEGAKLLQKDKLGRSTIFYAATTSNIAMLEYIHDQIGATTFRDEMSHQDVYKKTPWHYAVTLLMISNVDYCLAAGARPADDVVETNFALGSSEPIVAQQILLVLTLYSRLKSYLNFPVYAESYDGERFLADAAFFTIDQMHSNPGPPTDMYSKINQESSKRGLTWIHIPWTNGIMLLIAYSAIQKSFPETLENFYSSIEVFQGFRNPPTVIGDPGLNYRMPGYKKSSYEPARGSFGAVVFPCLVLQNTKEFIASRKFHHDVRKSIDWGSAKSSIQVARTLDEAYYPSLDQEVLKVRNEDQVVSRECRKLVDGQPVSEDTRPILMVPQFWIWKFKDHVLSAYSLPGKNPEPLRESDFDNDPDYERHPTKPLTWRTFNPEPWKSKNMGISTSLVSADPDLHIGLLLAHNIDKFGEIQANMFQSPLDIFEIGVIQVISRVEGFIKQPTSLTPNDIQKERGFMHDISDIRDELAMVGEILRQQEDIFSSVAGSIHLNELGDFYTNHKQTIMDASQKLNTYRERVKKIDRDAERIEKNIQDQLNLKRTYASIRDARASIREARTSVVLGTAVIGFTIITVIFTPLAFMTSLFALPIDGLVRNQIKVGDTDAYTTNYVGKYFATVEVVSLVVTGLAVCVPLFLLKTFAGSSDDAADDGKRPVSTTETTEKSRNPIRFWRRRTHSEGVDV